MAANSGTASTGPDGVRAQRTVTAVMAVIAGLAFVFSFGNVWALALRLGLPRPIAPLIAPMVDLSVVGLLVALWYLSLRGVPAGELRSATRLMHLCGLLTLGLNVAEPLATDHYGRAALDAVAPLLLIGWGVVGPQLLRHFHQTAAVPAPAPASPIEPAVAEPAPRVVQTEEASTSAAPVPAPLLEAARRIAAEHHALHGQRVTVAQLRTRLGVAPSVASSLHAQLTA